MRRWKLLTTLAKGREGGNGERLLLEFARAISGSEAFRKYEWLKAAPVKNVGGNFRGMVVSARWRAVFDFSEKYIQKTEKVSAVC